MTHIILVRHGSVPAVAPEEFRGRIDLELTELGFTQSRATAAYIAKQWGPTAVYTSPLSHCVATGQEIANACGAASLVMPELNELDYGIWQGKTHEEVCTSWPDEYWLWRRSPHWVRFPGGESLQALAMRTAEGLRIAFQQHPDDTVVFVGHDAGNRALLLQVLELPLSAYWSLVQDPCAVSEFLVDENRRTVVRMNESAHLRDIKVVEVSH